MRLAGNALLIFAAPQDDRLPNRAHFQATSKTRTFVGVFDRQAKKIGTKKRSTANPQRDTVERREDRESRGELFLTGFAFDVINHLANGLSFSASDSGFRP